MIESLGDLLRSRSWERALFTTYSLSLTFFESVILRELRQKACREIWIAADAQGYQSSLMERRSHGVGQEYHLVPVALPHGVFHPKCCYLQSSEGDLLVVGSGNLTFGGYGRNLEVLDVVTPVSEPQCFREFGRFLNALKLRTDIRCPDNRWMDIFADRAFESAGSVTQGSIPTFPRLVHSVNKPVIEQLAEIIGDDVERITILSPYYDNDGEAVRRLIERFQPHAVSIGIPPAPYLSGFPFPAASAWDLCPSAVRIGDEEEKRPIHAKWMELKTPKGMFVVTGSVNCTRQALLTVNNTEVAIARYDAAGELGADWTSVPVPAAICLQDYQAPGLGSRCLVYAELNSSGQLDGQILASAEIGGLWTGSLQKPDGTSLDFTTSVSVAGGFSVVIPDIETFAFSQALQMAMQFGALFARGWVQNTEILAMPRLKRLGISSLLRLINREETEDDDIALLDYLALHAAEHLTTFKGAIRSAPKESSTHDAMTVHLEDLSPIEASALSSTADLALGGSAQSALDRVFAQLRRRFLGNPGTGEKSGRAVMNAENDTEGEDAEAAGEEARVQARLQTALNYFDANIRGLIDSKVVKDSARNALYSLWLEVMLHMILRRQGDRSGALAFLKLWFRRATEDCHFAQTVDSLEQHVVTSAAVLGYMNGTSACLERIHEALEAFWSGSVPSPRAQNSLLKGSRIGFGSLLLDFAPDALELTIDEIVQTRTRRLELAEVLHAYQLRLPLSPSAPAFAGPLGIALYKQLLRGPGKARVKATKGKGGSCPNCFCSSCSAVASDLRSLRLAVCTSCNWMLVRTEP